MGVYSTTCRGGNVTLVTIDDLSDRLKVPKETLRRWRKERRLPAAVKIGRTVRWREEDIEAWLAKQTDA